MISECSAPKLINKFTVSFVIRFYGLIIARDDANSNNRYDSIIFFSRIYIHVINRIYQSKLLDIFVHEELHITLITNMLLKHTHADLK